ncbi:MAG: hypothetical protein EXR93_11500 [Gemmatimonadetes bacterium]|nr:hypothetical protein [Gemmatimonadota bacterium]
MKSLRLDRVVPGIGRLTARCPSADIRRTWDALLTELYDTGRLEILRLLKRGALTFREVLDAQRRNALTYVGDSVVLARPLWVAVGLDAEGQETGAGWLATAAPAPATRRRYGGAWRAFQRAAVLGPLAQIRDLDAVDWRAVHMHWTTGPTGWNHVRRTVSAFLTTTLGGGLKGKFHPFRLEVMSNFPRGEEPDTRVPELPIERFWEILQHVPAPLRPCYVAMAAGGLGPGEYLRCQDTDLRPLTQELVVIGTKKGRQGKIVVKFGPRAWPWVRKAVPCPIGYEPLLDTWQRACRVVGQGDNRLYDLRHCTGQWSTDAGMSEARVGDHLRDKTPGTIRRYTRSKNKGEVAQALDVVMFDGVMPDREAASQ